MSDKIPLKSEKGQPKEFTAGEVIPVKHGGTGANVFPNRGYMVGDGSKKVITIKCEYTKTTDPTKFHDTSEGYSIGSRWINIATQTEWLCVSHKYRDAVWISCCSKGGEPEDTFRYYISLVDFKYDHQDFEWERRYCQDFKDVSKITYRYGGTPPSTGEVVGVMELSYNQYFQPTLAKMTYKDSTVKLLSFTYDEDEYFKEAIRI